MTKGGEATRAGSMGLVLTKMDAIVVCRIQKEFSEWKFASTTCTHRRHTMQYCEGGIRR